MELVHQRYQDADLTTVASTIDLDRRYGKKSMTGTIWLICAITASLLTLVGILYLIRRRSPSSDQMDQLPEHLTPFKVHQYLERLCHNDTALASTQRQQLEQELATLEKHYFSAEQNGHAHSDLQQLAKKWMLTARNTR